MITLDQISQTKAFKAIKYKFQVKMLLNKESRLKIQHGVIMSNKTSFEQWKKVCSPTGNVSDIVFELIQK